MNVRPLAAVVALTAVLAAMWGAGTLAPAAPDGQAKQADKKADKKTEKQADKKADKHADKEPIAVRYAEARLRLAELTLKKSQDLNKRVPLTIPNPLMSQFTDDVTFAKSRLEAAKRNSPADAFQIWIERAEVEQRTAEAKLKQVLDTERAVPGTFSTVDLDRFRVGVEMAKLQVERGRSLVDAPSEAKLHWQMEMIGDSLVRLREQIWLISQNRGPLEF